MTLIVGLEVQSRQPVIAFSMVASATRISATGTNAEKLVG